MIRIVKPMVLFFVLALLGCNTDKSKGASDGGELGTDSMRSDSDLDVDSDSDADADTDTDGDTEDDPVPLPRPACAATDGGGSEIPEAPTLLATLHDSWQEAWSGSPAVADLDGDGEKEILVPRYGFVLGWHLDGEVVYRVETHGERIWASPVVADLVSGSTGLEVAAASREKLYAWDSSGKLLPNFPVDWVDEIRSLAAGDIDGDGALELVVVSTNKHEQGDRRDVVMAYEMDGSSVSGFPPNTSGASGCDDRCYVTGGFDQNIALGNLDGDEVALELVVAQDNAYLSVHHGDGVMFDSAPIFEHPTKFAGIRFLHDYALAQQGWAPDEANSNQAHFTNSSPAVADYDGDGNNEIIILGSVQNASQNDRFRGVALWVLNPDGTRPGPWEDPYHASDYLAGLWDYDGTNVVGANNEVTVADIDPAVTGPEFLFAGFDGRIHAVKGDRTALWQYTYTTDDRVLTGGVVVADLSGDGIPEVVFASYSPDEDKSHLFILGANGQEHHKIALPQRGAMPVPTIADADGNGTLEIVVSLKDGETNLRQVLVYTVPGSQDNCLLWPTGRANYYRNGYIP